MNIEMQGKIAIVTGSARGIGKAIAAENGRHGANGRRVGRLDESKARRRRPNLGPSAIFMPCDISDRAQVASLIDTTVQRFGRLDVMVNNAGINAGLGRGASEHRQVPRRNLGPNHEGRSQRHVLLLPRGRRPDGQTAIRLDRQHFLGGGRRGLAAANRLRRGQGGDHQADRGDGVRNRPEGRPRQRHFARLDRRDRRQAFRRCRSRKAATPTAPRASLRSSPRDGWASPRKSPTPCCFSPPTPAAYVNGHNLVVDGGWTCGFNRDW